ncbi:hypothetical protein IFM89_027255 [Coptis chinensis]|uniref:MULE transposase domain-containing protein n=1 Tax=Coptis chinensis TaxID=261450 RepID=A0A835HHE8_9MAGN|nr:hypothetical protein IFM89_027255 [Coptis chinensis]
MAHDLLGVRKFVIHYGGCWGKTGTEILKMSNYKDGKIEKWELNGDELSFMDLNKDVNKLLGLGVSPCSFVDIACLIGGDLCKIKSDQVLMHLWNLMKPGKDKKFHLFLSSTAGPPPQVSPTTLTPPLSPPATTQNLITLTPPLSPPTITHNPTTLTPPLSPPITTQNPTTPTTSKQKGLSRNDRVIRRSPRLNQGLSQSLSHIPTTPKVNVVYDEGTGGDESDSLEEEFVTNAEDNAEENGDGDMRPPPAVNVDVDISMLSNNIFEKEEMEKDTSRHVPEDIQAEIMSRHGVHISYWTAWSTRVKILENINGNYEEGYRLLPELCRQVQSKNPGTIARWFYTKNTREFVGVCIAFKASIDGWLEGCRPILGLDGSFLKGKYGGCCLFVIGLDAMNDLFPIGICICQGENKANWQMLLKLLKPNLDQHREKLTFILDRQKGLIPVVHAYFPDSNHRFCFEHIFKFFKKVFKGDMWETLAWDAARKYIMTSFTEKMSDIVKTDQKAPDWMMVSRELGDYDVVVPTVLHIIKKREAKYKNYKVSGVSDHISLVQNTKNKKHYCVDLEKKTLEAFKSTYFTHIHPIAKQEDWEIIIDHEDLVNPPEFKPQVGRPKKQRIRDEDELKQLVKS